MKLEPNHIDDIFRQRLHDAEVQPPAFVWPNVEHALQKRKRRRFFPWLFVACGIAAAALWAILERHDAATQAADPFKRQIASEKEKETPPAAGQRGNAETRLTEQEIHAANSIPANLPVDAGQSPKGGFLPNVTEESAHGSSDGAVQSEIGAALSAAQPVPAQRDFADFSPLETGMPEPLAFSRKENLPQAKIFVRKKKDPKYCYDFAQNPNVWMLDAYAGPSFNKRTLDATDPAFESYAQMRRATEQPDWSFHAGLRGSLLLSRHFLIRTGLHYEQTTEVFEYADPNYVKYIVEIINQPGEPTIIDTVGVEYGDNYIKTYNRYGLLDVPLEIGGEFRRGRFGLSVNAGVSLNILFWKRGTILSPGGQPEPFTPGEKGATEIYRPAAGWSASGSAQLFFHLKPTVRLFAEPYYRQTLKPVTLDNQEVEHRNSNWGLKIGVTKILD